MSSFYAIPGENVAYADLPMWQVTRHVLMDGPPPTPDATANADGTWVIDGETVCDCLIKKLELKQLRKLKSNNTTLSVTLPIGTAGNQVATPVEFNPCKCNFQAIHDKAAVTSYNGFDGFNWKCDDGVFRYLTAVVMRELSKKLHHYEQECFDNEKALVAQLDVAEDPNTVDLTVGWPSTSLTVTI